MPAVGILRFLRSRQGVVGRVGINQSPLWIDDELWRRLKVCFLHIVAVEPAKLKLMAPEGSGFLGSHPLKQAQASKELILAVLQTCRVFFALPCTYVTFKGSAV